MSNISILAAFERMWLHVVSAIGTKADAETVANITNGTTKVASATTADSATTLGSSTVGSAARPIYLNQGVPTKITSLSLQYGGTGGTTKAEARTNLGAMSATDPVGTGTISMNRASGTTAGSYSSAMGYNPTASGDSAHAEGRGNKAIGDYSHAEGFTTTASGEASHAEGYTTTASGDYSHAEGFATTALASQHVQGHYNKTSSAVAGTTSGTAGTAFVIGNGTSSSASNAFRITYGGKAYSPSTTISNGADYAEFFEWQDSNPNAEDRRGYFVTLDGNKIKIAEPDDYILGIVSGRPAMIGNGDADWTGRYILDEFGDYITEEFEYEEEVREKIVNEETGEVTIETKTVTKTGTKYKENPDYDPSLPYVQREDRPEWDAIGMIGVLSVRDDGTCEVNGYCKVADGGIATASENGYRIISRVNENIVKVVFK